MKERATLAIAVCVICFLIGYLAFLGTMIFVEFLESRMSPCQTQIRICSEEEMNLKRN